MTIEQNYLTISTPNSISYFDGKLHQLIGWRILGWIITFISFGLLFPWATCMVYAWETSHTVIDGRRLRFDGNGGELFLNWIKWFLLTLLTLGIYGFWLEIKVRQWKAKHTHFA